MFELLVWGVRLAMILLMVLLLFALAAAMRADLRAASEAPATDPASPTPTTTPRPTPTAIRQLVHVAGPQPVGGASFPLQGPVVIGRDAACQIVLPSTITSKRHASVTPHEGGWIAQDLGSTNGTLLNGTPLTTPARLQLGDRLLVGETEFEVR